MIFEMPDTSTAKVSKSLVSIREEGGAVALGRVLTLVISTAPGQEEDAIAAANEASREHPMRVIVVSVPRESTNIANRLDAEIRVGGDAGASEVVILRAFGEVGSDERGLVTGLLLPDTPVVVWWPNEAPPVVSQSPLGLMAQCRITDAGSSPQPMDRLGELSVAYSPGDADFAWTRITPWRTQLAAALDQPPHETITGVSLAMSSDSPSGQMLAAWLSLRLGVDVSIQLTNHASDGGSIHRVVLTRASGDIVLTRINHKVARIEQPGQPTHDISFSRRSLRDCLAEELRRLDPDVVYGDVVTRGLPLVSKA
ncbi:MAG: glucose-6-phosphate dehydrogenase assembly protein OpcA [Aurantimicrobium sp.]|nr:glucose-6-phosphate dehydrogenase assembly protein OpcA [Aurantimicrobium sp.]